MRVLVTYMTQTGNTQKVAEAIYDGILAEKEIVPLSEVRSLEGYDLAFVGFPIVRFGPVEAVTSFLARHTPGKRVALFVTHAAEDGTPMLDQWLAPAREAVADAELLGVFNCQGQLAETTKQFMLNSGNPELAAWAANDTSQGQPDEARLERARAFAREIMAKVAP